MSLVAICHTRRATIYQWQDLIAATSLVILLKLDSNHRFVSLRDLQIWWMTSKNNRAPLLYYVMLIASFQSHHWIQTGVTVRKRSILVKIDNYLPHLNLQFDDWPWKIIGHLFCTTSSFVHHFKTISEFKLELQSGNAQFQSKSAIFLLQALCIISKPSMYSNWSYSPETLKLGQNQWFFGPCDLIIWRLTLKNNRAPLSCYFKLCASCHNHPLIQTGVTVLKRTIWV